MTGAEHISSDTVRETVLGTIRLTGAKWALRAFVAGYRGVLALAIRFGRKRGQETGAESVEILVTGTFYSDNWLKTHLVPLALSRKCGSLVMVASSPVPPMQNVKAVYPPQMMRRLVGDVAARLILFCWLALRTRPQFIMGFHLLLNGMVSVLLARIVGAKAIYICGGGPREVLGGGYLTENRLFGMLGKPDPLIERWLIEVVGHFDSVIVMGSGTRRFFESRGASADYYVVPGGFDGAVFSPGLGPRDVDLVLVGRLSGVKRVDLFLRAVGELKKRKASVSAVVVGDGPDRRQLEALRNDLGLEANVTFAGWRNDIENFLRRARIFVLTSDSEGVSQAMIQAMLCGNAVVVSDVGDLRDLVEDGVNGRLISERTELSFSDAFAELLGSEEKWRHFGANARKNAERFSVRRVSNVWDEILDARGRAGG